MPKAELTLEALEHRVRDIEQRQRALDTGLRKSALDHEITYHLQLAIFDALLRRWPGAEKEVFQTLEHARQQARAEDRRDDTLALDSLVYDLNQRNNLPAND